MVKKQVNFRASDLTRGQLDQLQEWWGATQSEVITVAVDRAYREVLTLSWKEMVPGCFGPVDLDFGSHPADSERAKEMFKLALDAGVTMQEIVDEVKSFLDSRDAPPAHTQTQLKMVRNLEL